MQKLFYLFSLLILPLSTSFAQQVVSTNADDGAGSLRAAITAGNLTNAPYSISFTMAGPISLTAALPEIIQSCTIIGQSLLVPATASGGTTIERSTAGGIPNFRIFKAVTAGKVLVLQDLILQNGVADEELNFFQGGGALYAKLGSGELTMARCLIRNCATTGNKSGGGVQLESGSGIITDCQFSNNTVSSTTRAGGGFINGTEFSGNPNLVTFQRCTFVNNRASRGGAFFQRAPSGTSELVNCSFSANSSTGTGNAIFNYSGNLNLVHCSFIGNSGAGRTIYGSLTSSGPVQVVNCLFSGNTNSGLGIGNFYNPDGLIISLGGNVSNEAGDSGILDQSSDKTGVSGLVGPLQQNLGGLVSTHSIGDCSPAKDAGVTSVTLTLPTTDANNQARISPPDAGAYEVQPILLSAGPITVSGPASCASPARLTAPATGQSFVFTGPGGYVFSNAYRSGGSYTAFAEGIKLGGTYTLTVYGSPECPSAPTTSTVVVQGPSSCP